MAGYHRRTEERVVHVYMYIAYLYTTVEIGGERSSFHCTGHKNEPTLSNDAKEKDCYHDNYQQQARK